MGHARTTRSLHAGRLAVAVAVASVSAGLPMARGQATTRPAATSQPAAVNTPAVVDTNSPKAAVKTFVAAEIKGDGKAIRDVLMANTPTEQRMAGAIADLAVAIADLDRAMIAKFGAAQTEPLMGDKEAALAEVTAKVDRSTESVNGETATVTSPADPTPDNGPDKTAGGYPPPGAASPQDTMLLKKVAGQWKVSVSDMAKGSSEENVQRTLASVDTAVAGYRSVLADLNAGKLPTVDSVAAALNAKMIPAGGGGGPGGAAGAGMPAGGGPGMPGGK